MVQKVQQAIHFVVDETDDTCLAYDETTINSSGGHVGTYEFDVNLELVSIKDERGQVRILIMMVFVEYLELVKVMMNIKMF